MTGKAAIVGIGATEFSKNSGRSELRLAIECITAALADAGIAPEEVNGLLTLTMDNNGVGSVARSLGIQSVSFFAEIPGGGGGGCGTVALAAAAIEAGLADVVVCYRAMNERSQERFGLPSATYGGGGLATSAAIDRSWHAPYGLSTPASTIGMTARRYMHEYGARSEDFGRVSVASRRHAATNPKAWFYGKPITLEDHQASRMIVDPLHLLDCCQESDGGVAIVVVSAERARASARASGSRSGVLIAGAAQGMGPEPVLMSNYYRDVITTTQETGIAARQLWQQSGLSAADIDVAILYDHFTPAVLMQLEALGFCGVGEAPDFIRDGAIEIDGRLPVNTHGGQLGEAYIHGFNGIAEAVRQLRGTAVNQVKDTRNVVVTSGSHVPTSALVLSRL
ncbi:MAG: lipid-transfer protein [Subtercola sp.]|nr:lipid-transfer protein [Subtercola sp.]